MNSLVKKNKSKASPTRKFTSHVEKDLSVYTVQSKNASALSNISTDFSDSEEELDNIQITQNSIDKKRKHSCDILINKPVKIRKTINDSVLNKENSSCQEISAHTSSETISSNKLFPNSLSSNIELTIKNKSSLISNDSIKSENLLSTQGTDTLEGLDDLFEEEWSYKKDTLEELDEFFEDNWDYFKKVNIDFSVPRRCTIIDILREKGHMTLKVKDVNEETAVVNCSGIWYYTTIEPGEPVIIKARKELESSNWIVDENFGWLINQPDTLIAGTSVVGALFCNRRSVFKEKFRMLENLPYYKGGNNYMLIGSLAHELLQMVLDKNIKDLKMISKLLDDILKSKHAVHMMYINEISMADCKTLMQPIVNQIYEFIQRYVNGIKPKVKDENFDGKIEKICDIEENVWLPNLGLKGKIDLTVEVTSKTKKDSFPSTQRRVLPLEIKTGKTSFSSEHQGQLILYTMMMNMTGRKVDSGLLLYLRENIMKEIVGSNSAQRDLLSLRNTVAYYSTRQPIIVNIKDKETIVPMKLPKPISHPACAQCPYNVLCCAYLNKEDRQELYDNHPLKNLCKTITSHLSLEHTEYVKKWVSLLQLEEMTDNQDLASWKDVWTLKPSKREKRGSCISNLNIVSVSEISGRFLHVLKKSEQSENESEINLTNFSVQEYVIISTNERINICSGYINNVTLTSIFVLCEKDITKVYKDAVFHIDKQLSSFLLTQNMSQLGGLLDDHEICSRLRKIIIEKQPATFKTVLPTSIMEDSADILSKLNKNQREAILKMLSADDYLLIKGFPGTGKTQTLVAMVELLVKLNKSVIVTAHTNTAVDNILLKLLERKIDFVRFGSGAKIHPELHDMLDENITANCDSPEILHTLYCSKKVVGVTCYGSTHPHLSRRKFDICIVDESTQVLQPTILQPLFCASKFVLVGDPEQLPPIAKNNIARKFGINESLFSRLDSENNVVALSLQYRMNSCIMNIANKLTYHNQLQIGNKLVGNATLPITDVTALEKCEKWVKKALSPSLKNSAVMLNTSATHQLTFDTTVKEVKGVHNYWETSIVVRLIEVIQSLGVDSIAIGIIAPYRAQVRLLRSIVASDIEVNTVDQYQGRDKSVIIYSCTKSMSEETEISEFNIMEDHQRLTVAVTRAKHKLIIIGDLNTLQRFTPYRKFIAVLKENDNIYDLKDGKDDFSFNDLIKLLP